MHLGGPLTDRLAPAVLFPIEVKRLERRPVIDREQDGRRMDKLLRRLAYNVKRLDEGRGVLRQHMTVDAEGEPFMASYNDWLDIVIARGRTREA